WCEGASINHLSTFFTPPCLKLHFMFESRFFYENTNIPKIQDNPTHQTLHKKEKKGGITPP
ncbi:hypothetical protein, partial [Gilliamella sp. Pas-s95]|uniref:hypothetical protein n=1 Tax=Gilliamella sp. Pas-s95 TaxID=2687317 RepID=UPI001F277292